MLEFSFETVGTATLQFSFRKKQHMLFFDSVVSISMMMNFFSFTKLRFLFFLLVRFLYLSIHLSLSLPQRFFLLKSLVFQGLDQGREPRVDNGLVAKPPRQLRRRPFFSFSSRFFFFFSARAPPPTPPRGVEDPV